MRHIDLFSGIGGFALAVDTVWHEQKNEHIFCDNEPFAQAVLKKHWPDSPIHSDIREFDGTGIHSADILTGGFPCQPFSHAGLRKGTEDDRHLWPHMFRVIRETAPRWVIGENVRGFVTWNDGMVLEQVCTDLEGIGYEVWPFIIPAVALNAPHRRDRVWIVAQNTKHDGSGLGAHAEQGSVGNVGDTRAGDPVGVHSEASTPDTPNTIRGSRRECKHKETIGTSRDNEPAGGHCTHTDTEQIGPQGRGQDRQRPSGLLGGMERCQRREWDQDWPEVATRLCTLDDGLPNGLVRPRGWRHAALKAAGNAIVPQVAMQIMHAIKEAEEQT